MGIEPTKVALGHPRYLSYPDRGRSGNDVSSSILEIAPEAARPI